jgi:signal peptide peptidase-like 2B
LIAFCFYVDAVKKSKIYLYGLISLAGFYYLCFNFKIFKGYSFGMICTFVALILMETGQPALIYLVPFTLIPISFWGFFVDSEGTLGKMWRGEI